MEIMVIRSFPSTQMYLAHYKLLLQLQLMRLYVETSTTVENAHRSQWDHCAFSIHPPTVPLNKEKQQIGTSEKLQL